MHNKIAILLIFLLKGMLLNGQDVDSMIRAGSSITDDSLRVVHYAGIAEKLSPSFPDSATVFYKKAIEICRQNNEFMKVCQLYEKISLNYHAHGMPNKAAQYSQKLIDFSKAGNMPKRCLRGCYLLNFFLLSTGRHSESLEPAMMGIKLADSLADSSNLGKFYNRAGVAYERLASYPKALDYYRKAQAIAESTKDSTLLASALLNSGNIMEELGKPNLQLTYYQQALEIRREQKMPGKIAALLENIGIVYLNLKQYDQALQNFNQTLAMRIELKDSTRINQTYINIGIAYERLGDLDKALENYSRVLPKLQQDPNLKAKCLANISDIYYKKGLFVKAEKYAGQGLQIARSINNLELLRQSYKYLVKIYDNTGQFKKALDAYKNYTRIKDSISGTEISKQLQELETKYQTEKIEQKNKLNEAKINAQDLKLKQQKLQNYALISGLLLVFVIAMVVLRGYRHKKRANELLNKQKLQIEDKNKDLELANVEITQQKDIIQDKNNKIIDSIRYARRIQETILPPRSQLDKLLPDSFVFYNPKDIVSGDFYWLTETDNGETLFSAIDCTGHGVPGAFVSIVGHNSLNRVVKEFGITQPAKILDKLNELVVKSFSKQQEHEVKDGMDMALCLFDRKNMILEYAGANNPLYIIRNGELMITKADKQPIGAYENHKPFTNHRFELKSGDVIYIFSDGYTDQFGGPRGKKFMSRRFREMLLSIHMKKTCEQKSIIQNTINEWMHSEEQIDDMLIMGVKV